MSLTQLPSGPETLLIKADFPCTSPQMLFRYWTEPALLEEWWPQNAEIEPYSGGRYHLSWPKMNWHLRGTYTSFAIGKHLAFTWRWDSDEQEPGERIVKLAFDPLADGGTRLLLTHGPYEETPAEQELRLEHQLAGWQHFLARLQQLLADQNEAS
jgi:uncharacterized protein YndB with AHSA1/START domain